MKYLKGVGIHLGVWLAFTTAIYLLLDPKQGPFHLGMFSTKLGSMLVPIYLGAVLNATVFYGNIFLMNWLSRKQLMKFYVLAVFVFWSVHSLLEAPVDYILYLVLYDRDPAVSSFILSSWLNNAISNLFMLVFSVIYWFIPSWIQSEKVKRKLREEKIKAEMSFLKSQINPHLLFNLLNGLYAQSLRYQVPELSDSITKISRMMRYMVYETGKDSVALEQEIDYLWSFIEVYKLRIAEEDVLHFSFDIEGDPGSFRLMPMMLVPLVENAFKHGVRPERESFISIKLQISEKELCFTVENSLQASLKGYAREHSGYGLDNLHKRLTIMYPGKHRFYTSRTEEKFIAVLQLKKLDEEPGKKVKLVNKSVLEHD